MNRQLYSIKVKLLMHTAVCDPTSISGRKLAFVPGSEMEYRASMKNWKAMSNAELQNFILYLEDKPEYDNDVSDLIDHLTHNGGQGLVTSREFSYEGTLVDITVHAQGMNLGPVTSVWDHLGTDVLGIVDKFEPKKTLNNDPIRWMASTQEESVEVSKAASKMCRRLDEDLGYNHLMHVKADAPTNYEELLTEVLDLLVVCGTGIKALDRHYGFSDQYDIQKFCRDYVIFKTARAMNIDGSYEVKVKIEDYRL